MKKHKCTLCGGPHRNLIYCPKLPQYLPYGNNQVQAPGSLCIKCMGTEFQNADQCTHGSHGTWKRNFCEAGNISFILCTVCPKHLPALEYLSKNHNQGIGFKNFVTMKGMFGPDAYQACSNAVSVSVCNSLPAVSVSLCKSTLPKVDKGVQVVLAKSGHKKAVSVSVSLCKSTVPKVDKGVQVVLAKSGHKEAIWKEAEEGNQVERLTLDKRCIITLGVICVILIGLMWYHVVSKINHVPG